MRQIWRTIKARKKQQRRIQRLLVVMQQENAEQARLEREALNNNRPRYNRRYFGIMGGK